QVVGTHSRIIIEQVKVARGVGVHTGQALCRAEPPDLDLGVLSLQVARLRRMRDPLRLGPTTRPPKLTRSIALHSITVMNLVCSPAVSTLVPPLVAVDTLHVLAPRSILADGVAQGPEALVELSAVLLEVRDLPRHERSRHVVD